MKSNAIITASDRKYGDFLIEHWLRSLRETTNLDDTDVVVIDYGLSVAQAFYLEKTGAIVLPGNRDGHVTVIRFREIADFLASHPYKQVLACDSGDIIFQKDISPLFADHPDAYRAVYEDYKTPFGFCLREEFFDRPVLREIRRSLNAHDMINAGMIVAPGDRMRELAEKVTSLIKDKTKFGPDQVVVNYVLHAANFVPLDRGYNFVINTAKEEFAITDGTFTFRGGEIIPIVHNAGNVKLLRPVENFGYGSGRNDLRKDYYEAMQRLHQSVAFLKTEHIHA